MITIYTLEEIKQQNNISEDMREELLSYFEEIAKGIVGQEWQEYSLEEVGPILVIEEDDTIDVLDEYGLMQGNKFIPEALPEFAISLKVGTMNMFKIIWVCTDSFGISMYCPVGKFGNEFDEWIKEYLLD